MPVCNCNTIIRVFQSAGINELKDIETAVQTWKDSSRRLKPLFRNPAFVGSFEGALSVLHAGLVCYDHYCEELAIVVKLALQALSFDKLGLTYDGLPETRLRNLGDQIQTHMIAIENAVAHELRLRNARYETAGLQPCPVHAQVDDTTDEIYDKLVRQSQKVADEAIHNHHSTCGQCQKSGRNVRFDLKDDSQHMELAQNSDILNDPDNYEDIPREYVAFESPARIINKSRGSNFFGTQGSTTLTRATSGRRYKTDWVGGTGNADGKPANQQVPDDTIVVRGSGSKANTGRKRASSSSNICHPRFVGMGLPLFAPSGIISSETTSIGQAAGATFIIHDPEGTHIDQYGRFIYDAEDPGERQGP
ncbi:hypothetical protein DRE_00922 [Drechslerella stenobrocha 248]|uniref:Uncharacterized protein n=1 Tax=Drechslerella stenobrocha 248 TaxID=1043628 RepID=W7HY48_9PEZI|nr:hypothetical protein DRE_00922 [Drechslerella stenobrocha 248]